MIQNARPVNRPCIKVLYILGSARGGTTLLARLLGEIEGVFAAGEVRFLWQNFERRLCGCGDVVRNCSIWGQVVEQISASIEPQSMAALPGSTACIRHLPAILTGRHLSSRTRYADLIVEQYALAAKAARVKIVVDSSKSAAEVALLSRLPGIELFVVHLVRDPRGVAYSHQRRSFTGQGRDKSSVILSAAVWGAAHLAAEAALLSVQSDHTIRLKYEDLVMDPDRQLRRIAEFIGHPTGDLSFLSDGRTDSHARHMVGGHAIRFTEEVTRVHADTAWHDELAPPSATLVGALTLPLLYRYGYSLRRPPRKRGANRAG